MRARPTSRWACRVPPRSNTAVWFGQATREFGCGWLARYVVFMAKSDIVKQDAIMADFGDQYSDLLGGNAGHQVKIPNPMYYLP